jgi:hypothetical protein
MGGITVNPYTPAFDVDMDDDPLILEANGAAEGEDEHIFTAPPNDESPLQDADDHMEVEVQAGTNPTDDSSMAIERNDDATLEVEEEPLTSTQVPTQPDVTPSSGSVTMTVQAPKQPNASTPLVRKGAQAQMLPHYNSPRNDATQAHSLVQRQPSASTELNLREPTAVNNRAPTTNPRQPAPSENMDAAAEEPTTMTKKRKAKKWGGKKKQQMISQQHDASAVDGDDLADIDIDDIDEGQLMNAYKASGQETR